VEAGALVFELRDLWPESIVAVGALRPSLTIRLLDALALHMYRKANAIVCVSRPFMDALIRRGIPASKLAYVPNGIDPAFWNAVTLRRLVRRSVSARARSLRAMSGRLAWPRVGTMLEAARLLKDRRPDVRFLVVGDGAERDELARRARHEGLGNVTFTGLLARERIPM